MPGGMEAFAADCRTLAKAVRTLPTEIRKELAAEVKTQVAEPLGEKVADAARGKWAHALSQSVTVRAAADPTIVVGGGRSLVRNGATGRQLIFGTEFGGGNRVSTVNRAPGRRGRVARGERGANGRGVYKRHTTRQFNPATPYVFDTVEENVPWVLDRYADIVMKRVNEVISG